MPIRLACATDLQKLQEMYQALTKTFEHTGPSHETTQEAGPARAQLFQSIIDHPEGGFIFVMEEDETLTGMLVGLYTTADASHRWRKWVMVQDIFVDPAGRQKGVGRALVDAAEQRAKDDGRELLLGWIAATNDVMLEQADKDGWQTEYLIRTKLL